jgi:hypothetical protein
MYLNYQTVFVKFVDMQSGGALMQRAVGSKPKLLIIVTALVISFLFIPVILPHIMHPSMIYHIFLHIISLIIALFLSIVSILSYKRSNSARVLFMTFGFFALSVIEILYLFHATANLEDVIIPIVDIELSHIILFVMLTLFGIGVLKVNK